MRTKNGATVPDRLAEHFEMVRRVHPGVLVDRAAEERELARVEEQEREKALGECETYEEAAARAGVRGSGVRGTVTVDDVIRHGLVRRAKR